MLYYLSWHAAQETLRAKVVSLFKSRSKLGDRGERLISFKDLPVLTLAIQKPGFALRTGPGSPYHQKKKSRWLQSNACKTNVCHNWEPSRRCSSLFVMLNHRDHRIVHKEPEEQTAHWCGFPGDRESFAISRAWMPQRTTTVVYTRDHSSFISTCTFEITGVVFRVIHLR